MGGTGASCSAKMQTGLSAAVRLPSRLQRPAACKMESSPQISRYTVGKSTSTPASIRLVATTRQGCPACRRVRICRKSCLRWAGHCRVVRQKRPSAGSAANSSCAVLRRFTMHSSCADSFSRCASAACGSVPRLCRLTRRNAAYWAAGSGQSSRRGTPGANSANRGCRAGWVAVHKTAVQR